MPFVICDPSFMATNRGRTWIERALLHGVGMKVSVPAAYFGDEELLWSGGGLYGFRAREQIWGDQIPELQLLHKTESSTGTTIGRYVEVELVAAGHLALAQIWAGLQDGGTLVARRSRTLDALVMAGAALRVARRVGTSTHRLELGLPAELEDALLRRTRFVCRLASHEIDQPTLCVTDLGWRTRR